MKFNHTFIEKKSDERNKEEMKTPHILWQVYSKMDRYILVLKQDH